MKSYEICFDARMLFSGGIGTYIRNILPGLKEGVSRLRVIVHPNVLKTEGWLEAYDLILSSASIYSVQEQVELFLRIPKVDLFFSPHYNIPLLPIKAARRIVTIHDVFHLAYSANLRWHERLYAKYVMQKAVDKSDLIITDSQFSFDEICKYTKRAKDKIRLVHCGVDRQLYKREKSELRIQKTIEKFSLPSRYFLFVGNLKLHKNLTTLLLAIRELPSDIKLIVIGKSEGMKHIDGGDVIYQQHPDLHGRVIWLSSLSNQDLPVFYQLAQGLVFPSYYEGFGLPPLEAMSCGCPVIASNAASLPEVCGAAALYVFPGSPKEIGLAMKRVLSDLEFRQRLIEAGYENVSKFNWKSAVAAHINLLQEVLCTQVNSKFGR